MRMIHNKEKNRGQILVEVMIAVSITIISLTGFMSLLITAFQLNQVVGSNYVGTYLAQEGVEIVKNMIDNNAVSGDCPFGQFKDGGACTSIATAVGEVDATKPWKITSLGKEADARFLSLSGVSYAYSGGAATNFKRTVSVLSGMSDDLGLAEIKVISKVTWTVKSIPSEIIIEDHFFRSL